MTASKRQSLAATLRLSLFGGAGALGWIALGATGASAAEVPATSGLLGSVSDVVGAVSAPASSVVDAVADPLGEATASVAAPAGSTDPLVGSIPLVSGLEARVPQLLSHPAGTVLPPVTSVVDGVVARVPVVHHVVPAGTVTHVTAPVVGAVDDAVAGVTPPVVDAVAPVVDVVQPVVGVVSPVVDVVSPVVDAVAPVVDVVSPVVDVAGPPADVVIPVVGAVEPVVEVAGPPADVVIPVVEAVEPVVEVALPAAEDVAAGVAPVPAPSLAEGILPGEALPMAPTQARSPGASLETQPAAAPRSTVAGALVASSSLSQEAAGVAVGMARFAAQAPELAVAPNAVAVAVLTTAVLGIQEVPHLPVTPVALSGGALSFMTSAGSSAPLATLGAAALLVVTMITGRVRREAAGSLPAAPCFDPGSSPD